MVVKMAGLGRSFAGVAAYCLQDRREPGEPQPETSERVEWTDTRNLPTSRGERAAAVMAATAEAAPEFKRLAGGSVCGRKLEKPVCHYSLNWAKDETPDRREMSRAVDESVKALGLEKHQALIVAHRDTEHRHVHVIVNRVDLESGRAAGLSQSKLRLSKWAEGYEQAQGRLRCEKRVTNNARRSRGERVQYRGSLRTPRYRRDRMHPDREPRKTIPAGRDLAERRKVAWQRAEERELWQDWQQRRWRERPIYGREWAELYARQGQQRERLANDWRRVGGRWRMWREGGTLRELGGVLRGSPEMLRRWREEMEQQHRRERAQLAKAHFEKVGEMERGAGETYRKHLEQVQNPGKREGWRERVVVEGARWHEVEWKPVGWEGATNYQVVVQRAEMQESVWDQVRETEGVAEEQRQRRAAEQARKEAMKAAERQAEKQREVARQREATRAAERARLLERQRLDRSRDFGPSK